MGVKLNFDTIINAQGGKVGCLMWNTACSLIASCICYRTNIGWRDV